MRRFIVLALFATVTSWLFAQRSGSHAHFVTPGHAPLRGPGTRGVSGISSPFARRASYGPLLLPYGFLADDSSSGEVPESFVLLPQSPRTIEMQQATTAPLVIELRGDRYVRLTDDHFADEDIQTVDRNRAIATGTAPVLSARISPEKSQGFSTANAHPTGSSTSASSTAIAELAPAILIFRDGHSEEVRDYSIANGVMYARGNYYIDGFWSRQIVLTSLNLPETLQSNQARGVRFVLPASPNEVVTRP